MTELAALFEPNEEGYGLKDEYLRSDAVGRSFLKIEAGGSLLPASAETIAKGQHFIQQEGKTVFKFAVSNMADASVKILERNQLSHEDVQWLAPHQANKRIIEATAKRINLDPAKVMMNIQHYGNTTSATLPLLLADYEEKLKKGRQYYICCIWWWFHFGSHLSQMGL